MDVKTKFPIPKFGKSSKSERHWPNPEESTGKLCENIKLGRKHCWEAVGIAREKFEGIASEIKIHLEKHSEPVAHSVVWTIYMIGRNETELAPTIMFCGRDKKAVTEIKEIIKISGIMERYPGFRMGIRTEEFRHFSKSFSKSKSRKRHTRRRRSRPTCQPCSGTPVKSMRTIQQSHLETGIETPKLHDNQQITSFGHDKDFGIVAEGVEDHQQTHIGVPVGAGKAILYSPSDTGPIMRICIQGFHGESSILQIATGSGFICNQGSTFLTTVAHAFSEDDPNAPPASPENCDIEIELDNDSDEEDDMEFASRYSYSVAPSESSDETILGKTISDTTSESSDETILGKTISDITSELGFEQSPIGGACRFHDHSNIDGWKPQEFGSGQQQEG